MVVVGVRGGRAGREGPSHPLPFESGQCTPCLKRGWFWESSRAAGLGSRSQVLTTPGTSGPGMGPGWVIFLTIMGLNIHSFLQSKLEIPLH